MAVRGKERWVQRCYRGPNQEWQARPAKLTARGDRACLPRGLIRVALSCLACLVSRLARQ